MPGASWLLHPADDQVLPAAGHQHDLALPALNKVDAAARVQRNRLAQDERPARPRLRAPHPKSEYPGCRADQRKDPGQDGNHHEC